MSRSLDRERLIILEGGSGVGKTTVTKGLRELLPPDWSFYREPGGTGFGDAMRDAVQGIHDYDVDPLAAFMAYSASRANLVALEILPVLGKGMGVVVDRWWYSSYAYQGGDKVDKELITSVSMAVTRGLVPGVVLHYDLLPEIGMARKKGCADIDRFDMKELDFHRRVRDAYLELSQKFPDFWRVIDASQTPGKVFADTVNILKEVGMMR